MKKLFLNLNSQTLTNLDSFETCQYKNENELIEEILDKNEATKIYIYDLSYYWRYITRLFLEKGMSCKQFQGKEETLDKNTFTIVSSFRDSAVIKIKAKGNQAKDHNTTILDAKNLLGGMKIEDVVKSTEIEDENEAVAFFLNFMIEEGYTRDTLSSNAFKSLLSFMYPKSSQPTLEFNKEFTSQLSVDEDVFCRRAYHGGFCWIKPELKNTHIEAEGLTYDVNSLFPSVMEKEVMPVGKPIRFEGKYEFDKRYPLYFQEVVIFNLELKEGGIPCVKAETVDSAYYEENTIYPFVNIVLNSVDMELLLDNYKFEHIEYVGGYKFKSMRKLFSNFINHWKKEKNEARAEGDKLREKIAKLMLNSAYGKFGSKLDRVPVEIRVLNNNKIAKIPVLDAPTHGRQYYVPVASYITSYGKKVLVNAIKANYDRVIYVDTDSIHLIGTEDAKDIKIHDSEFGAWKIERKWTEGKFIGLKKYAEKENGKWTVKCAGLPADIIEEVEKDIDLFALGTELEYSEVIINGNGVEEEIISVFTIEERSLERVGA